MILIDRQIKIFIICITLLFTTCITKKAPVEPGYRRISGTVQDSNTQEPIPDAIVKSLWNQAVDTTDNQGYFQLDSILTVSDILMITSADYDTLYETMDITRDDISITIFMNAWGRLFGYYLYACNWGYQEIFVIDTYKATVVDTFYVPGSLSYLDISPDGSVLYAHSRQRSIRQNHCFNTETGEIMHTIEEGMINIMPDGRIFHYSDDGYEILDPFTYNVLQADTLKMIYPVIFDPNRPLLYSSTMDYKNMFCYNYNSRDPPRIYENLCHKREMVLSPDGRNLYAVGGTGLVVYDLDEGEYLATLPANSAGDLAITLDGREVYVTDPGSPIWGPGSGKIWIVDTASNTYYRTIEMSAPTEHTIHTDQIIISPDGDYAFVSNNLNIFIIELNDYVISKTIRFVPGRVDLKYLALGIKPLTNLLEEMHHVY